MSTVVDRYDLLQRKCVRLHTDRERTREDLWRCREENAHLRQAALLWIHLYERQVVRANNLEEQLQHRTEPTSPLAIVSKRASIHPERGSIDRDRAD